MTRTRTRDLGAGLALAIGLAAPSVHAEIVEFTYHASIFFIEDFDYSGDEFDLRLGDPISMSYVIDLQTPDLIASPTEGAYDVLGAFIEVGGYTAEAGFSNPLFVDIATAFDEFDLFASGFLGADAAVVQLGGFGALADDSIPVGFDLEAFTTRAISYSFETPDQGGFGVTAMVHSYDMRLIPGGGAMAAVAIGGLWFGGRRRRTTCRTRRSTNAWDALVTHTHTQALP